MMKTLLFGGIIVLSCLLLIKPMNIMYGMMMEVAADVSYTDETTGGVLPENATEDYTVANARISIGSAEGNWRTMLWVRNLADEDYYPSAFWAGNGPFGRTMGMPRTYGVTFSYFIGQ